MHIGRLTTLIPAAAVRSSVSATTSGGWIARLQQWPQTARPANRRRTIARAMCASARAPTSPLSSQWKSTASPRSAARSSRRSSSASISGETKATAPRIPPAAATRFATSVPSAVPKTWSGANDTAWSSMRPAHCLRSSSNTGQVIAPCGDMESR